MAEKKPSPRRSSTASGTTSSRQVSRPQEPTPAPPAASTPQSYIVRNVTPGPHWVSDLKIGFDPFQAIDLAHLDGTAVKTSLDLRKSIRIGILERITEDEYEYILQQDEDRRRQQLEQARQKNKLRRAQAADGREFEAEDINLNAEGGVSGDSAISTAGFVNDMESYAMAFQAEKAKYAQRGQHLDARQFDAMIKKSGTVAFTHTGGPTSSMSGQPGSGSAYVAMPPSSSDHDASPTRVAMGNYTQGGRLAGAELSGIQQLAHADDLDLSITEEIDLALDDDEEAI